MRICQINPLDAAEAMIAITALEVLAIHVRSLGSFDHFLHAWSDGTYLDGILVSRRSARVIFVSVGTDYSSIRMLEV